LAPVQSDPRPCNSQNDTNPTNAVQSDRPSAAKDKETSTQYPDECDDLPDYDETIFWQPEVEDDQPTELRKISDAMCTAATLLRSNLSRPVPNEKRRALKRKIPPPESPFTKCPKLDPAIMECLPKTAKDQDRSLAKTQTWVLDAIRPLVEILESARAGTLNSKVAQQSLTFIGNAAASISAERRRKAAQHINRNLASLVEDPDNFTEAAPMLFGLTFHQKVKDHLESLRSLKKSAGYSGRQYFQKSRPQQTHGGGNQKGNKGKQKIA